VTSRDKDIASLRENLEEMTRRSRDPERAEEKSKELKKQVRRQKSLYHGSQQNVKTSILYSIFLFCNCETNTTSGAVKVCSNSLESQVIPVGECLNGWCGAL